MLGTMWQGRNPWWKPRRSYWYRCNPLTVKIPVSWRCGTMGNNQWQQQLWSRAGLTLAVCAAEVVLLPKSFRVQKSRSWYQISNTELLISLNSALFWFECNYADGLVCIRKQGEQAMGSKPESSVAPWPLLLFLPPVPILVFLSDED